MVEDAGDIEVARAIDVAVHLSTKTEEPWPERLELRDAIDELRRWLGDDRQWNESRSRHWRSLLNDLLESVGDLGPRTRTQLGQQALESEIKECRRRFDNDATVDVALRTRLARFVEAVSAGAVMADVLIAAFDDLVQTASEPEASQRSARHLLTLAHWAGHDSELLVQRIGHELTFARPGQPQEQVDRRPLAPRLDAIRDILRRAPDRAHFVIWLRFQLAKVEAPRSGGRPVIEIGDRIRLYQGDWLRGCLTHPAPLGLDLPPEVTLGDDGLKSFCGLPYDVESGRFSAAPADPRESPVAYLRADVGDELASRAVEVARTNAEALAAIGVLYGSSPDIWKLDDSYVAFIPNGLGGSTATPPSVEEPTFEQRRAVHEDRTSRELREMAPRLAPHLPVRDAQLERATTMLGWLRSAAQSPEALQVVLYDRVIEAVAGWAGFSSHTAFVSEQLIPWWAYSRMRGQIIDAAYRLYWDHLQRAFPDGDPWSQRQEEIRAHPPLGLRLGPKPILSLKGVVSEVQWLLQRVPPGTPVHRGLSEIDGRTRTGRATSSWWTELCRQASKVEARRVRTRNALMHGGALAPATVGSIVQFAGSLAREALAASLEGRLLDQGLVDYFLDRQSQIASMRSRLDANDPPAEVLFAEPS